MPFQPYLIEPVNISRHQLPNDNNQLECCSNLTLADVIRQIGSLSQHASLIFDNLTEEAKKLNERTIGVQARIEKLKDYTENSNMNLIFKQTSLDEFYNKKRFRSIKKLDQDIMNKNTRPDIFKVLYEKADPPPDLDKLTPHREDGISCLKSYSDPTFFFTYWKKEVSKAKQLLKAEKIKQKLESEVSTQVENKPAYANEVGEIVEKKNESNLELNKDDSVILRAPPVVPIQTSDITNESNVVNQQTVGNDVYFKNNRVSVFQVLEESKKDLDDFEDDSDWE